MFIDKATISVKAGNGGNGCCSFRREAFVPKGGPNGGDGAPGGDVIFVGDPGQLTLLDFLYNTRFSAQDGGPGKGKDMHGRRGKDLRIKVPVGKADLVRKVREIEKFLSDYLVRFPVFIREVICPGIGRIDAWNADKQQQHNE